MTMFILSGCGSNGTAMDAAKTLMQGMIDGDSKAITKVDHSDFLSFPPDHMVKIANENKIVGMKLSEFTFESLDDQDVKVKFKTKDNKDDSFTLHFLKVKDGYFFDKIKN
jgi:hypothetical protein